MPNRSLFDIRFNLLEKSMDFMSMRHDIVASNLANINTPGYISKDLSFEEKLRSIMDHKGPSKLILSNPRHLPRPFTPELIEDAKPVIKNRLDKSAGNDLNTVDLDVEMAKMVKNQLLYSINAEVVRRKFGYLRYSIQEGR